MLHVLCLIVLNELLLLSAKDLKDLPYFFIKENSKKCFYEELPEHTMMEAHYRIELMDPKTRNWTESPTGIGMHCEIKDPQEEIRLSKTYSAQSKISYTSEMPGEHVLCLHSNSTTHTFFGGQDIKVYLVIKVGEHAIDYAETSKREKYTELELRIRQLNDQCIQISKEQNYQRVREEHFRRTSESTNKRVLWWSIAQTLVLVLTGLWQMKHLKSFFEAKKLV